MDSRKAAKERKAAKIIYLNFDIWNCYFLYGESLSPRVVPQAKLVAIHYGCCLRKHSREIMDIIIFIQFRYYPIIAQ